MVRSSQEWSGVVRRVEVVVGGVQDVARDLRAFQEWERRVVRTGSG